MKRLNETLTATALPLPLPCSTGEHRLLGLEKNGAHTAFVAQQLAGAPSAQEMDVNYAGLMDRCVIPHQWFNVYLLTDEMAELAQLRKPEFKALSNSRCVKKLRTSGL